MRVRKDVWKLPAGDNTLEWYGKAITAMKALPMNDPGSWVFQAAVHGIKSVPPAQSAYWAQCQHGSSFFLPWHRMYILRFERIVAAKIEALGGPKDWALPYWDYSTDRAYCALPVAFRSATLANGSPNPLYTSQRSSNANDGAVLEAKDVDVTTCLKAPGSTAPAGFFGEAASAHFGGVRGALEQTPHNTVHRWVGGGDGLMSSFDTAALDPIFWLHHSNIDRLWEVWLHRDPTHLNLTTAYWLKEVSFKFYDEHGSVITMTTADVLNLADPALNYSYEDIRDPLAAPPGVRAASGLVAGGPAGPTMNAPAQIELVGATAAPIQLGSQVLHVQLPTPVTPQVFKATASPNAVVAPGSASALVQRVIMQLENVTSTAIAPTYDVYVNVPDAQDPSVHEDRFVGRVAMFGIAEASDPSRGHGGAGQSFAFDITDLYHRLFDEGEVDPKSLRVSFVPVEPEGDPRVSVGRIGLYFA